MGRGNKGGLQTKSCESERAMFTAHQIFIIAKSSHRARVYGLLSSHQCRAMITKSLKSTLQSPLESPAIGFLTTAAAPLWGRPNYFAVLVIQGQPGPFLSHGERGTDRHPHTSFCLENAVGSPCDMRPLPDYLSPHQAPAPVGGALTSFTCSASC